MVVIHTDGSNIKNGKPDSYGGYGFVIQLNNEIIEGGGHMPVDLDNPVTNNRAELLALIESINTLLNNDNYNNEDIIVNSDSQWVVNCFNGKWKKRKNPDLWKRLLDIEFHLKFNRIKIKVEWVRGHNGLEMNERADRLAYFYRENKAIVSPL